MSINPQASKRQEALILLEKVVDALTGPEPDPVACLRRYLRAAQLLQWSELMRWVAGEINGYPSDAEPPSYRLVAASLAWRAYTMEDEAALLVAPPPELQPRPTTVPLRSPVTDLLNVKELGYRYPTGGTSEIYISSKQKSVPVKEICIIEPIAIKRLLDAIANNLYSLASRGSIVVRHGQAISSALENYIALVDDKLLSLGIGDSLKAAYENLRSDNPESWKLVALACRNIIIQLANTLWQAPDQAHPVLKGGDGKPMSLAADKEKNRLVAYIHHKVQSKTQKQFFKGQAERLATLLHGLFELGSKGKYFVSHEQALSCLINTYVFLGDLAIFTDMEPVTKIEPPK
ncbi:MAG: hypothetical protein MUP04_06030 [Anaerolineae bacterium]|nr:hypothetical protein [Anaerolineae bacterium]